MPEKRFSPEQIIAKLRQIEVQLAKGIRHKSGQAFDNRRVELESPFSCSSCRLLVSADVGAVQERHSKLDTTLRAANQPTKLHLAPLSPRAAEDSSSAARARRATRRLIPSGVKADSFRAFNRAHI